jgi:PIN domain nuclease of toxin-antitoxin system
VLPRLLLDTHILIRWLIDSKKLSREQDRGLEAAVKRSEPVAFSAITLLEISVLANSGSLKIALPDFLASLAANPIFRILPLSFEVAAEVAYLAALKDPADRTIVATSRVHRLTLVTSDERIINSGLIKTVA